MRGYNNDMNNDLFKTVRWCVGTVLLIGLSAAVGQCKECPAAKSASAARYAYEQVHMGTRFKLTLYADSTEAADKAANAAFARIAELDGRLSHYKDDSELSRLCRASGSGEWASASEELWLMLTRSVDLSRRTDGAFDVTVGPLVQLWRRSRRRKELPSDDLLKETRQKVGYRLIELDHKKRRVRLSQADMRIDLGGIAKGYAADEARRVLAEHGICRVLIDAGGDLVAGDPPPEKKAWTVAIAAFQSRAGRPVTKAKTQLLALANAAAATSGDRYQFAEIDGKRYSHIIDPRTGLGLATPSRVTVIAPDGVTADSLASAVSVLGPKAGMKLIDDTPDCAALFVRQGNSGPEVFRSKRLERWIARR